MIHLVATRSRGWLAVVIALRYVINGLSPSSGEDAGVTAAVMLMLAMPAVAVRASRRVRGETLAELRRP